MQTKDIRVITDDEESKEIPLKINLNIKPICTIAPKILFWLKNEKPSAKDFTITFPSDDIPEITNISSSSEIFEISHAKC